MRQRPFPPAHGGGNLCGNTLPPSRTPTPGSQRKYAQSVWVNRTLALLGDMYVDCCPHVSSRRYQAGGRPPLKSARRFWVAHPCGFCKGEAGCRKRPPHLPRFASELRTSTINLSKRPFNLEIRPFTVKYFTFRYLGATISYVSLDDFFLFLLPLFWSPSLAPKPPLGVLRARRTHPPGASRQVPPIYSRRLPLTTRRCFSKSFPCYSYSRSATD